MLRMIELMVEGFSKVLIVASPFLVGVIVGIVVYGLFPTMAGLVTGVIVAAIGLVLGVAFVSRVSQKNSAVEFVSRVSASPELNNLQDE